MSNPTTHVSQFNGNAEAWVITGPERYDDGLWLEEGTVNLFPNPSAETAPSSNWGTVSGTTKTRVNTEHFDGDWAYQYDCAGLGISEGCAVASSTGIGTTSQRTFTASIHHKGAGTCELWARATYTDTTFQDTSRKDEVIGADWGRVVANLLVTDPAKTLNFLQLMLRTKSAQAVTFWADAAQIEEKDYATSFVAGTRAASSAAISPSGILTPDSGSLAFRLTRKIDTGDIEYILNCGTDGDDRLRIYIDTDDRLRVAWDTGGALPQSVVSSSTIAVGTEYLVYTEWDGINIAMSLDAGTLVTGIRDVPLGSWGTDDLVLGP